MKVIIDVDINFARQTCMMAGGAIERVKQIEEMSDEEIVKLAISHSKCYGIEFVNIISE